MASSSPHDLSRDNTSMKTVKASTGRRSRSFFIQLKVFLERIKYVPWFSLLLILMLGWATYQVATRPHSPAYAWCQKSMQRAEKAVRRVFSAERDKKNSTQPTAVSEKESPGAPGPTVDFSGHHEKLIALEKHLESMQVTINQLQQTTEALRKDFDSITPRIEDMSQALNAQAQQLPEAPLKEATTAEAPEDLSGYPEAMEGDYSVHAVIQGRAWLNTPDNKILTVNVGSQLPGFGTVQQIDTDDRLVYFDHGRVIGPSANDS